jgi:hypothetical protein
MPTVVRETKRYGVRSTGMLLPFLERAVTRHFASLPQEGCAIEAVLDCSGKLAQVGEGRGAGGLSQVS